MTITIENVDKKFIQAVKSIANLSERKAKNKNNKEKS